MARKARQRISYVLPLANSSGGHRLGVNGLEIDTTNSILYSGGRDGVICAWDIHVDLHSTSSPPANGDSKPGPRTATLRSQVQAHTNWVNDVVLAQSNQALVSASSDVTVKAWRPAAQDAQAPQTIGSHSDYVKVLASPEQHADWVASGGLDHKICLWDLNGAGQKIKIEVKDDDGSVIGRDKGSVYALAATPTVLASGGPESVVRVWDPRSGKRVTKFAGHTDNIRDLLVSRDGETIMSASSDQTIKVWSVTAGRCVHTLTMHDASVWSLWSSDPRLSVFYSSDRNGLIAKTDTRGGSELDDGICVAVAQEDQGVHKLVSAGDYIWTATSRPSINRWRSVDTMDAEMQPHADTPKEASPAPEGQQRAIGESGKRQIPLKHCLRLSNTAFFPSLSPADADGAADRTTRRGTIQIMDSEAHVTEPVHASAETSIQGQNGLIKHIVLNDRRRVLTVDTAGEVVMWDLLKCVPIQSFGKRHIEDVQSEVSKVESVPNWCSVDTRTGSVTVTLEENSCFDAELYADDLEEYNDIQIKDDQRINLGKWVLRYLFATIITEEIKRDQEHRKVLLAAQEQQQQQRLDRSNAPLGIQLPPQQINGWQASDVTPKATNGLRPPITPGFNISLATPGIAPAISHSSRDASGAANDDDGGIQGVDKPRQSGDYFSDKSPNVPAASPNPAPGTPGAATEADKRVSSEETKEPEVKDTPSKFGKKFSMKMNFSMKKLGATNKTANTGEKDKASTEDKDKAAAEDSDARSEKTTDSEQVEDNFLGCIQKLRLEYKSTLALQVQQRNARDAAGGALGAASDLTLESLVTPSLPSETPVLKPPASTTILIQEDRPEAGGVVDLFEGRVGELEGCTDKIEKVAPMWLGEILLRNALPLKEVVKVSFVLEPWNGVLPAIATDGQNRLNANRMLRARKVLAYVAERIEPAPGADEAPLPPAETYLELWCNKQRIEPRMTLATIKAHVWRSGGDVMLYYRVKDGGSRAVRGNAGGAGDGPTQGQEQGQGSVGGGNALGEVGIER